MWQGVLQKPSEDVFQFVLKLISQAKRRSGGGGALSLEGIYKSLNRYEWNLYIILYIILVLILTPLFVYNYLFTFFSHFIGVSCTCYPAHTQT